MGAMTVQPTIGFRPCVEDDLVSMARWAADPEVARWWYPNDEPSVEMARRRYGEVIDGTDPSTTGWIIVVDGTDAGFIQCYAMADEADYARQLDIEVPYGDGAIATDLYLGEADVRDRGGGTAVMVAFLRTIVFGERDAPNAIICPDPENARARRCYERAGLRATNTVWVEDPEDPDETGYELVMVQSRAEFVARFGPIG